MLNLELDMVKLLVLCKDSGVNKMSCARMILLTDEDDDLKEMQNEAKRAEKFIELNYSKPHKDYALGVLNQLISIAERRIKKLHKRK